MAKLRYNFQLLDIGTGENISAAGGVCHVSKPGSPDKATLYDKDGAALANPVTATRGAFTFYIDDAQSSTVDLYIMAPGGQFIVRTGVAPSGPNEIHVDTRQKRQLAKIPYSIADSVAATEKDTGFDVPNPARVLDRLHGAGLYVTTIDATQTIDVGILSSESGGDADGLIAASSVATAGLVTGTNGALFSSNAPHKSDAVTGKSISYTLNAGSDTAKGFIMLPYDLV
jgi:hypothetical protein